MSELPMLLESQNSPSDQWIIPKRAVCLLYEPEKGGPSTSVAKFATCKLSRPRQRHRAEIDFLTRAAEMGCRAYGDGNDLGAVADDGRECRIVWRGHHRRELVLIEGEQATGKKMFANSEEAAALRAAAEAALAFLQKSALVTGKVVSSARRS
jgi:hypothetical protein